MSRLFSALQIPQQTTQALISLQDGLPKAQWINPQNFHVTLSFFGEVENFLENELMRAFETIKLSSFILQTKGFEVFGSKNAPHSLVVRIAPCEALNLLHEQMQTIRNRLGFPAEERQFIPHITLARLLDINPKDLPFYLSSRGDFSFAPFEINHFVLLLSPSPSSDTLYKVKGSWMLQNKRV
ncbi:RNA 2',3'-cyclic phosphodiesterase [Bartonella raoultii]|uniref:RNA 2',3'-cyclic phosphodiesterase n=1 Tax=Bartonella raoultii TaxID=1457020 RepID=A0ABS7I3Q4_9HYPH|nr:RNA 2',3'-cyclic phosphodiesterase [Bartonella raoultii]MBX4335323.1 RNA 2',3'-cyclic phosphodiesterase [Bartonella raoultii]